VFSFAAAAAVHPQLLDPARYGGDVVVSLARRLFGGAGQTHSRGNVYAIEAVVCIAMLAVLRVALMPAARRVFFWWTGTDRTDKSWLASNFYWVILNVYGPLEGTLWAVAGMRAVEAGIERAGLVYPLVLQALVERLVVGALVVAGARVALNWQERYFAQATFELELGGQPLQVERLAGLNKLSSIATYIVAASMARPHPPPPLTST
jgi:hypothetical protein